MKRFYVFMSMAMIVIVIAAMSVMTFTTASAATTEVYDNVVFVSDNATKGGDGSSPNSPLYPSNDRKMVVENEGESNGAFYNKKYYLTALYQAAEKLVNTGGTIVICGPVVIDNSDCDHTGTNWWGDFVFPESDYPIVITSSYNGVNYQTENNAYLGIHENSSVTLGAPTTFENIKINTQKTGRVICANGNKLVMGNNITTSTSAGTAVNAYVNIAGGTRYEDFVGDADITIKSGTYGHVCGTRYSTVNGTSEHVYNHKGNVKITIEGGTINGNICGGDINETTIPCTQNGNVQIDIHNGTIKSPIVATGKGRFSTTGNTVKVNIYGGNFTTTSAIVKECPGTTSANNSASKIYINLSKTGLTDALVNNFINNAPSISAITYPASWITGVTKTTAPTTPANVLKGETLTAEGAVLSVTYSNSVGTKTVVYDPADKAFVTTITDGTVNYKYGTTTFHTSTVNVIDVPALSIQGAKIKVDSTNYTQGLRFVVNYSGNVSTGVTIVERGVIAVQSDILNDESKLNFDQTAGMKVLTIGDTDYNTANQYSCTIENIPLNRFKVDYIAKAYVKLSYNGETFYVYSDAVRKNPYKIAQLAVAGTQETADVVTYLNDNVITAFNNYQLPEYVTTNTYNNALYKDATGLRTQALDYMGAQKGIAWTPSASFWLYNGSGSSVSTNLYFEVNKIYYGIPYTNAESSQLESYGQFFTNTKVIKGVTVPILDLSKIPGVESCGNSYSSWRETDDMKQGYQNYLNFPGSDCSTSVVTSWNTIINNRPSLSNNNIIIGTRDFLPGINSDIIPVGNYKYTDGNGATYIYTKTITQECNTKQEMSDAYNLLRPGDAIVYYKLNSDGSEFGHLRMVRYVEDGVVYTRECINESGRLWDDTEYSFDDLIDAGCIPITIPELVTGYSDEQATIVTDLSLDTDLPNKTLSGTVKSNRQVVYLEVEISDGTDVKKAYYEVDKSTKWKTTFASEVDLSEIDMSKITLTSGTEYTFTLKVCLPGEVITPIKNYTFTAK